MKNKKEARGAAMFVELGLRRDQMDKQDISKLSPDEKRELLKKLLKRKQINDNRGLIGGTKCQQAIPRKRRRR